MTTVYQGKRKKPFTVRRFLKQSKRFLMNLVRASGRGLYYGLKAARGFLASLPPRILLLSSSAFGFLMIVIIIIAIASPGNRTKASAAEALAAFESGIHPGEDTDQQAGDSNFSSFSDDDTEGDGDSGGYAKEASHAKPATFTELKKGDDHQAIAIIQGRLMELGYMDPDEPTEHFGPLTKTAISTFQSHNGLEDDGVCGLATYELLMSKNAKVYVMQKGDSGEDVTGVQQRLYELGYLDNKANITGNFGDKTEEAAKAFQKKNSLTSDGKVGNKTIGMLYGEKDVVSNSYKLGDTNPVILSCQQALKKLGYITFKPDGVMGRATVSAIKSFQAINGLTKDGCLGPQTRDLLLSDKAESKVIQLGDYGTDVKSIHERLIKLNYLTSGSATAYYGDITQQAIKAFQKRNSLTSDGKVGGVTLTILNSSSAKKGSSPVNAKASSGSSGTTKSGTGSTSSGGDSPSASSSINNKTGIDKLVGLAESKLGSTYVRGAKGPSTFDCSGFVYWCMRNAGVSCSYQTSFMWRTCTKYQRISSIGNIQRGDILVFYDHVGIYIGNGTMIDASSSEGKVRRATTVLSSGGYWTKNFICAYRIF